MTTSLLTIEERHRLFACFAELNPQPTTELKYHSPFQLLIAVILSAQATDKGVNKATGPLFAIAPTAKDIMDLGEDGLKNHIRTINYFHTKAKNIIQTCKILLEKFPAGIPNNREDLESLPGVGRKTANVLLNTLFHQPTIAVDTHIFRVSNRLGLALGKTLLIVENNLQKVVPSQYKQHAHHWLILHGRYVCTARKPRCQDCAVKHLCKFPNKVYNHRP